MTASIAKAAQRSGPSTGRTATASELPPRTAATA